MVFALSTEEGRGHIYGEPQGMGETKTWNKDKETLRNNGMPNNYLSVAEGDG